MDEHGGIREAAAPIGVCSRPDGPTPNLVCNEVWGGNKMFHGSVELPGMRCVLFSQPCKGARGGDIHYLSVCGSGLLSRVCLADVSGHGESVAAVSQAIHELLRLSVNRMDERKVLRGLNLRLSAQDEATFTTATALTYFPPTRRLSISYAGHEPAWYYDLSRQEWSQLRPDHRRGLFDIILAAEPRSRYTRRVRRAKTGDRLLMITDGVLEAPNEDVELFGRDRLEEVLRTHHDQSPEDIVAEILKRLRDHTHSEPLKHDDVSLLMIEFVDNLESSALWTAIRNRLLGPRNRTPASETE